MMRNKAISVEPVMSTASYRYVCPFVKTGAAIFLILLLFLLSGCNDRDIQEVRDTDFALGTTCSVTLFGEKERQYLKPALEVAMDVEEKMSVRLEDSEISHINARAGDGFAEVSDGTFALVRRAVDFAEMSNGVFDPTVGPLVALWDIGSGDERVPEDEAVDKALTLVDFRDVLFDEEEMRIGLKRPGMSLDLGAIAKGYAADRMVEYLKGQGVPYGIINLGGNVFAFGKKYGDTAWRIGIQTPDKERGRYLGILEIQNSAVVTSGKYERYFISDGRRYHHILDTESGYPVENGLSSVSIVSTDATAADALSTLVFGLGLEKGLRLCEELEYAEAIIVTEENMVYTSSGLRDTFRLIDDRYTRAEPGHVLSE